MQIQSPIEFFDELLTSIDTAESSVFLSSMNFETGSYVDLLVKKLLQACKRGLKVTLEIDWIYQHFTGGDVPLFFRINRTAIQENKRVISKTNKLINDLIIAGAVVKIKNTPKFPLHLLKIFGRDHKKIYCIDDKKLWLGGVNLFDEAFENLDLMIRFESEIVVSHLFSLLELESGNVMLSKHCRFILDRGTFNFSPIYDAAFQQINQAKHTIIFISQFLPDHFLLNQLIKKQKEGIAVTILTSHHLDRKFTEFPGNLLYSKTVQQIKKSGMRLIHHTKRVHAKVLITDDKHCILGSHNFTIYGVLLATEEIAVEMENSDVVTQIKRLCLLE